MMMIYGVGIGIIIFVLGGLYYFIKNKSRLIKVDEKPEDGFNFNYFLYIPSSINKKELKYLLVEPNNAGRASDLHELHDKDALKLVKYGKSRKIADQLKLPLLIPVFDRPKSEWRLYTHALNRKTLMNLHGKLARIDLQLISMIRDAKIQLKNYNVNIDEKVLLNGFSASGSFVNRFTALHPNKVKDVVSGGINCMSILPIATLEGNSLIYPLGIYDVKKIANIEFNINDYKKFSQLIYMGKLDDNDTLPYEDAFGDDERKLIRKILGDDMHGRWQKSKSIYKLLDIQAQMIMYDEVGHEVNIKILEDIIDFYKENMNVR